MRISYIMRIDLVREKILDKLSNVDSSNLMVALRSTKSWKFLFMDKCRMNRDTFCPICMLNMQAPLLDSWNFIDPATMRISQWKAPINNIQYPHQFTLDGVVFHDQNIHQPESMFILKESKNLPNHRYRRALRSDSSAQDIDEYFKKMDFSGLIKFSSEQSLLYHIEQVNSLFLTLFFA